ncbi:hypothetical protein BGZ59_005054 [Podila verticillata]|nr:hypothetical protein BGZ59_005054 [Podila verticillata]
MAIPQQVEDRSISERRQTRPSLLLETNPYAQGSGEAHMSYPQSSGASMMEGLPMVPPNHTPLPGTPEAHLSPGNFLTPGLPSVGSHSYPSHHQHGHYPPHQYFQLQRSMTVPSPGSMGMDGLPQEAMSEHNLNPSSSSTPSSPPHPQFPTLPSIPHQNPWANRPNPSRTSSAPYRISRSSDMAKSMGASGHAQTASFSSSSSAAPRSRTRTSSVTSSSSTASFGIVSSLSAAFGSTHLSYSETSSPTSMSVGGQQGHAYPRRNDYMVSPPLVGSGSFSMRDPRFSGPGDLSMSDDDPNSARKTLAARNFTCSFPGCNKAYTQLHNLKSHERTGHTPVTKLKPFMCIISGCTKAFSQRKSLAHHIKISHQEFKFKPFKCGQADCPKAYTQLHNLRTHEKTVHQLDLSKKRIRLPEGPREPGSFGKAMTLEQQHQQHQHQHQGSGFGAPPPLHFMEGQYKGFSQHNTHQGGIVGEGSFVDMYEGSSGGPSQSGQEKDDEHSEEGDGSHGDEEDEEEEEEEDHHGPEKPM